MMLWPRGMPSTLPVPAAVGFVIDGEPEAVLIISAVPAEVGLVMDGPPVPALITSAVPAEVGFVIDGAPVAVLIISAAPAAVGFVIEGEPLAVSPTESKLLSVNDAAGSALRSTACRIMASLRGI